jgi:hypothetical protein
MLDGIVRLHALLHKVQSVCYSRFSSFTSVQETPGFRQSRRHSEVMHAAHICTVAALDQVLP